MTVTASAKGVTSIDLFPSVRNCSSVIHRDEPPSIVKEAQAQLCLYLDGERREFALPIDYRAATPVLSERWKAIKRILTWPRARSTVGGHACGWEVVCQGGGDGAGSESYSYRRALSLNHCA